ncbi:MAG: recombination protein NinG [Salinirussus sp.]
MPRQKKCRSCGEPFVPFSTLHRACSPECAADVARQDAKKAQRKANRKRKEQLKTRGEWLKEAQAAFNAYIRERDKGKPCISCGRQPDSEGLITGSRMDAGHYRSTGSCPELRFSEWNCYAQCVYCNRHQSGNAVEFRIGLRQRIGDEALEWLEGPHEPAHYSIDDLKAIRDEYRRKTRELKRQREAA